MEAIVITLGSEERLPSHIMMYPTISHYYQSSREQRCKIIKRRTLTIVKKKIGILNLLIKSLN